MSDVDSYDAIWDYTEEELLEIDRLCNEKLNGAPCISIEVEGTTTNKSDKKFTNKNKAFPKGKKSGNETSLIGRFRRRRGYLSVSDIVGPIWCEVQYEYGLLQQRHMPLSRRPTSFKSVNGKEIQVKTDVAHRNDAIITKGKDVHKTLEVEIHKEEIPILITSEEEKWALTLLNFLIKLEVLKETQICREIPIWGIVQNQPLFGIIDELRLVDKQSLSTFSTSLEQATPKKAEKQLPLDTFLIPDSHRKKDSEKKAHDYTSDLAKLSTPDFEIRLYDNKTRYKKSLPSHNDTLPSRIQLMLYHSLLQRVLEMDISKSTGPNAEETSIFSIFCSHLGPQINIFQEFSDNFLEQMRMVVELNDLNWKFRESLCLKDMDIPAQETIASLGFGKKDILSNRLFLAYRHRGISHNDTELEEKDPPKGLETSNETVEPSCTDEVPEATEKVLPVAPTKDDNLTDKTSEDSGRTVPTRYSSVETEISASEEALSPERDSGLLLNDSTKSRETSAAPGDVILASSTLASGTLIGTKMFFHKEEMVMGHLESILRWWNGKRPPIGIDEENVSRCNSCEYIDDCEWREKLSAGKKV